MRPTRGPHEIVMQVLSFLHRVFCQGLVVLVVTQASSLACATSQEDLAALRAHAGVQEVRVPLSGELPSGPFFIRGEMSPTRAVVKSVAGSGAANDKGPPLARSSEAIARAFLLEFKNIWGLDTEQDLLLLNAQQDQHGNTHLRFARRAAAWQLEDMQLLVHINAEGSITAVNGNLVPLTVELKEFLRGPVATVSPQEIDATLQRMFASSPIKVLKRDIFARVQPPFLVWRCDVLDQGKGERFDVVIDAVTGDLIAKTLRLHVRGFKSGGH